MTRAISMSISAESLQAFANVLQGAASLREAVAHWRTHDTTTRMVIVDAHDMRDETPALRVGACQVYLASSNGHCWSVTQQHDEASALILSES